MCMFELVPIVIDALKKSAIDLLSRSGLTFTCIPFSRIICLPVQITFSFPLLKERKNHPRDREITKLLDCRIFFSRSKEEGKKKRNKDSPNYKIVRLIQLSGSN